MRRQESFVIVGVAYLAFAATGAHAQLELDVEGAARAAGGVTGAGRGVGAARVDGTTDVAAGVSGGVRGLSDAEIGIGVQTALSQDMQMPGVRPKYATASRR